MTDRDKATVFRFATESLQGRRDYQEDGALAVTLEDGRGLLAVADGMGGHAAGEVASALALEELQGALSGGSPLDAAVVQANRAVRLQAMEPGKQGMGTTLVAVLIEGWTFSVANVGDSRAYLWSQGELRQISRDHSFVAEAMARGQSEEEAMASRWKDALTRSIGARDDVEVDLFGPLPAEDASVVILCSDGMYKTLSNSDMVRILGRSSSGAAAARSLAAEAYQRGSDDNITVAVTEFGTVQWAQPVGTMPLEWPEGETPPWETAAGRDHSAAGEGSPGGAVDASPDAQEANAETSAEGEVAQRPWWRRWR